MSCEGAGDMGATSTFEPQNDGNPGQGYGDASRFWGVMRVNLQQILELLEGAGYDVKPVPGIDWLRVTASGGKPFLVKCEVLRTLAETVGADPHLLVERVSRFSLVQKVDGR